MGWGSRQRGAERRRASLWLLPSIALVAGIGAAITMMRLDRANHWALLSFSSGGAQSFLGALSAALVSFIGLFFSVITLAIQFAAGNLSPRVVKPLLAGRGARLMLGTATFTLGYTLSLLLRIEDAFVPQGALIASIPLMIVSIFGFIVLIDVVGSQLRFSAIYSRTLKSGLKAIHHTFPFTLDTAGSEFDRRVGSFSCADRVIYYRGESGVIHDFGRKAMLTECTRQEGILVALRAVGDYIYPGVPLFRVSFPSTPTEEETLHDAVVVGRERLLDHDPGYSIRLLVDIAIRALSPAINDPTTAVGCLDRIEHLLHELGKRQLSIGGVTSEDGVMRIYIPTPTWRDYVRLACDEIRFYGSESFQVIARLKALLEDLHDCLPSVRREALQEELDILAREVSRHFEERADKERATASNRQGLGGPARLDSDHCT